MIIMDAKELYEKLDTDFDLANLRDEWEGMNFNDFVSLNFQNRQMGVFTDNSKVIKHVYTAVFPSNKVLKEIIDAGGEDVLVFTHHPMIWDIRNPEVFSYIDEKLLQEMKDRRISIYVLHIPLDKNGPYSTAISLTKALGVSYEEEFCEYLGVKMGVIGKTDFSTPENLVKHVEDVVGHTVRIKKYGSNEIKKQKVALVGGGGNNTFVLKEIVKLDVNTFITGITVLNDFSRKTHEYAKEKKINIIGATHYSTEKFACIAMCEYFENLGLPCKFIEDLPVLEDM